MDLLGSNLACDSLCKNINICDSNEIDQRNLLEIPATDLTFTCPGRSILKENLDLDIYTYDFRNIQPADLRNMGLSISFLCFIQNDGYLGSLNGGGGGWREFERCFYNISCHAADLSYLFELERRVDCRDPREFNFCWIFLIPVSGLSPDVFIYCTEDGEIVDETAKFMERSMRRYWGNFARNGLAN